MATKKRSRKRSRPHKKAKRKVIIRRTVVKRVSVRKVAGSPITRAKKTIKKAASKMLKDALYERDCATSYKQHRRAQLKVDKARKELRRAS